MKRAGIALIVALVAAAGQIPAEDATGAAEEGFVPLFDGKTLAGWTKFGGRATYRVDGDCIVGLVAPGPNTFLCTEKEYGDFILKLEVKVDVPGNAGVQFRSHKEGPKAGGHVIGYQCTIDLSQKGPSGGVYDEKRRGWLDSLEGNEKGRKAFKAADWNEYVIRAVGPSIKTWVNGVPCADLLDTVDMKGFIALQVHSGRQGQFRWRNIRIKDLGLSEFRSISKSRELPDWERIGGGSWRNVGGAIHGTMDKSEKRHGLLITKKQYGDFALRLKFKALTGNSGVYFRVARDPGPLAVLGLQADVDPAKDTGGLYETGGRKWVARSDPKELKKWFKLRRWNSMSVIAVGRRIVVLVNDRKTTELTDDPGRTRGHIALQLHGGQEMNVQFRDIEILELPGDGPATRPAGPEAPRVSPARP